MFYPLSIKEKRQETKDAVTLFFDIPEDIKNKFTYRPGQFIGIKSLINGEEVIRSYSFSSEPSENKYAITVKKIENGRMSTFLVDNIVEGKKLLVAPPAGKLLPEDGIINGHQYTFFAAGSGITPMYSILKSVLNETNSNAKLYYLNKTKNDVIFFNELENLKEKYSGQLEVIYSFTQEDSGHKTLCGRPTPTSLKSVVSLEGSFYMCGPEGYMETIESYLLNDGVDKNKIHKESFATPVSKDEDLSFGEGTMIGDVTNASVTNQAQIKIISSGEEQTIAWDSKYDSILDQLVASDVDVPFSCMNGACMACMCKVTDGAVIQEDLGILTDDNIQEKESLSCQAKPASKNITLNFDEI